MRRGKIPNRYLWASAILSAATAAYATTILAVRTPKWVLLATDSRIERFEIDTGKSAPKVGCKIAQIDNLFMAAYGELAHRNYNVYSIARTAAAEGGGVVAIANRFEALVKGPLASSLEAQNNRTCGSDECLQVAFAGADGATPVLAVRGFVAKAVPHGIEVSTSFRLNCPGDCPEGQGDIVLGIRDHAKRLEAEEAPGAVQNPIDEASKLIGSEIAAHPMQVAEPIVMLIVTKDGAEWVPDHQGYCPRIGPSGGGRSFSRDFQLHP